MKIWFTTREAAEYLGYKPRTLEKMRQTGAGPKWTKTPTGGIRYLKEHLDEWIQSRNGKKKK